MPARFVIGALAVFGAVSLLQWVLTAVLSIVKFGLLVAVLIAAPVAWFAMDRWLDGFAYRIELGPGLFLLAGGLALAVAVVTVSAQALRAATADPVRSLRHE